MAFSRKITSWSISRLNEYEKCPLSAKLKFIDKMKTPGSPAMDRGSRIHDEAKAYIMGIGRVVPKDLKLATDLLKRLRAKFKADPASMEVEETWAFRKDWSGTVYNDWDGCWLRVKLDVAERDGDEISVWDWKSGKFSTYKNEEYNDQLRLYGLGALLRYTKNVGPGLKIHPRLVYTDEGVTWPKNEAVEEFVPKDVKPLQKDWERRVKPMFNDTKFAPKPNRLCGYCHFRKENGGPCQF